MTENEIQEIVFSGSTVLGYCITGLVYLILPVAAFLFMKRYSRVSIFPLIAGAVTYFLATRTADIAAMLMLGSASFAAKQAIASELVAYTEETGRWLAMKYPVSGVRSTPAAVCYAIGHGGLECLMRAADSFRIVSRAHTLNTEGITYFTAGKTPEQAQAITEEFSRLAGSGIIVSLIGAVGIVAVFGVQLALSLLVYKKLIASDRRLRWLALAMGLHLFVNFLPWVASFAGSVVFKSLTGIMACTAVIYFVYRITDGESIRDEILYPEEE
ncbi:MAG: YhfC family intramembrane metalloprotease [Ruminococcus sp.]|nr:YhfC family intramembrane metalloprotease [Ruminococcus sp.]